LLVSAKKCPEQFITRAITGELLFKSSIFDIHCGQERVSSADTSVQQELHSFAMSRCSSMASAQGSVCPYKVSFRIQRIMLHNSVSSSTFDELKCQCVISDVYPAHVVKKKMQFSL
jgi:hypothetical protein